MRLKRWFILCWISQRDKDVVVFHAGTKQSGDDVVTAGGRVLAVTAHAPTLREALDAAYKGVDSISFEGKTFRCDIAHRYGESIPLTPVTR